MNQHRAILLIALLVSCGANVQAQVQTTISELYQQEVSKFLTLDPKKVAGPLVGYCDETTARILYRPGTVECKLRLSIKTESGDIAATSEVVCEPDNDFVGKFFVEKLEPATHYQYQIEQVIGDKTKLLVGSEKQNYFKTASNDRSKKRVSVGFVSCVDDAPNGIWPEMELLDIDMLCLMGDTPYIDSSDLSVVRSKHRALLQLPDVAALIRHVPTVGVWDDHDFGRNNGNGANMAKGKVDTRRGFVEYRANPQFGTGTEGVYHKVDLGMMEIFMLDPRYFSQTENSPVDENQTTCFGASQWKWLLESLKASKAPFKVLAMGAIWQDKRNTETDDMFTYWYERDALLDFVKENEISGVVLLGWDIHVSRHLVHPQRVGYNLHDFVISPGHTRTIESLNVYHPSLDWSLVEGRQFLTLTADGSKQVPRLIARYRQPNGKVNREVSISLEDLTSGKDEGLKKDLRARWNFDVDFTNKSKLGSRIDAEPVNGASIERSGGLSNGAATFVRARQQYLNVPRSFLDDNSDQHTLSMWIKPTSLPKHGSRERHFLFESTAEGKPENTGAYHFSLGFRTAQDPSKINLELHSYTIRQATREGAAPTPVAQGGFSQILDRASFAAWNIVVVVFDSKKLEFYINGEKIREHTLPHPGPACEFGGLIIGGHREGTGRNFEGLIDEVAIWSRVLTADEIKKLHNGGRPPDFSR